MGITHFTSLGPNFLRQLDWTVSPGLSSLKIHKALLVYNFTSSFPHFPHSCTELQVICCGGYWEYKEQDVAWLMKISMSSLSPPCHTKAMRMLIAKWVFANVSRFSFITNFSSLIHEGIVLVVFTF